jgi:eukaryotic translation initiation factor 2C
LLEASEIKFEYIFFIVVDPDKLPARVNMEIMKQVEQDNPTIFTKSVAYDGRKIAYSAIDLPLGGTSRNVRSPLTVHWFT